ncbi:LCP family protein [Streptomyces natalensis]|uniref:LytR family transcriptional regulator n=1 Tax=Streptomyces natalensis ATCC 27448 TaxID=1240678 RepID=A0A0D7CS54_9ACTN|nr:LCP family protein [Streptomyces natalensis]KIZ19084.1 LytR family transcriptional regulator [Streptomyces natalensis ATCC 27448]
MTESPQTPSGRPGPAAGSRRTGRGAGRFPGWGPRPLRSGAPGDGPGPPRTPPSPLHWMRRAALGTAAAVLVTAVAGWGLYTKLDGNIRFDSDTQNELEKYEAERPDPGPPNAENILLIGSDNRGDGNEEYGADSGTQRSDTTILLHLAADRKSATAVSIPRDLMVQVPRCKRSDGKEIAEQTVQFNWTFQFAGAACTIRTVEQMTGIRITHHMIIDFVGFKKMVDAVDGVEICVRRPIHDDKARLVLPAGRQTLHGEDALGFVRARKSLGNGSDTQRMERQQDFLGALVKKVQSNGVLLNPTRLYPVLDAATSSLTTDADLASLTGLYELVRSMRSIPTAHVQFLTVPREEYRYDPNRDELVQPDAGRLFAELRRDHRVTVAPPAKDSAQSAAASDAKPHDPAPPPGRTPAFPGTTAEHGTCE